jgi:hypothetical protein
MFTFDLIPSKNIHFLPFYIIAMALVEKKTINFVSITCCKGYIAMLDGPLVRTAWRVLRLRVEGSPPVTEGSCKYIE